MANSLDLEFAALFNGDGDAALREFDDRNALDQISKKLDGVLAGQNHGLNLSLSKAERAELLGVGENDPMLAPKLKETLVSKISLADMFRVQAGSLGLKKAFRYLQRRTVAKGSVVEAMQSCLASFMDSDMLADDQIAIARQAIKALDVGAFLRVLASRMEPGS